MAISSRAPTPNADVELELGTLVDTPLAVASMVDTLAAQPTSPPSLYLDLEGVNLSRHGTLSILQIHVYPLDQTYLVDVHVLGAAAFNRPGLLSSSSSTTTTSSPATTDPAPVTLKTILESATTPKVFFDVRHDSDALYAHFGIKLACVFDLQLMELAMRTIDGYPSPRLLVVSLAKCIAWDAPLTEQEREALVEGKERGKRLFCPSRGGGYEVFERRPMMEKVRRYCVMDVWVLPRLWEVYAGRMTSEWEGRVRVAERERVEMSQSKEGFMGGWGMVVAPEGWEGLL